jgi:hypothetical protein
MTGEMSVYLESGYILATAPVVVAVIKPLSSIFQRGLVKRLPAKMSGIEVQ